MVQSLYPAKKTDGEKTKTTTSNAIITSPASLIGSNSVTRASSSTSIASPTPMASAWPAPNEQQIARSGSGGSECLFSRSAEELLDLDADLELRSDMARYHNNNIHNANLANNFSIDDQDFQNKGYSQFRPASPDKQTCCFPDLNWKRIGRWRLDIPIYLNGLTTNMAFKRQYTILLCLLLLIISCLIASVVISRRVGDLDGDGDTTGGNTLSLKLSSSNGPLEARTIDLIDLIESGKTFAYAKYRIQVKLPKTSSNYDQHPGFLLNEPGDQQEASTNLQSAESNQENCRYFLTSVSQSNTHADELKANQILEATESTAPEPAKLLPVIPDAKADSLLDLQIKPVNIVKKNDPATPGIEDVAALLAMTATGEKPIQGLGSITDNSNKISSSRGTNFDQRDPIELAASELDFSLESINKTLIDCFLVDTEKRYDQKVSIEDTYRQVTSTRQVGSKKMMDLIVECRKLTWASQPKLIKIKSIPGEKSLIAGASSEIDSETMSLDDSTTVVSTKVKPASQQPQDIIGALLGSWLHYGTSAHSGNSNKPEGSPAKSELTVVESRERPMQTGFFGNQNNENQQKQASFLNMGISMVNGIIPNTLWCGLGDRAANYSELGAEYKVDACCRAHDHCPVRLKPFTIDYGLVNWSMSTRSHCNCDTDFNDCLMAVNSTLSNVIKVLYFRFVGLQCIDVENRDMDQG